MGTEGLCTGLAQECGPFIKKIVQALAEQAARALRQGLVECMAAFARLMRERLKIRCDRIGPRGARGAYESGEHDGHRHCREALQA